jgi:hypothetical protein
MVGLICLLFLCSICSQGDINENIYGILGSQDEFLNKRLLTIDYGKHQMHCGSNTNFHYCKDCNDYKNILESVCLNNCALMPERKFVKHFSYDDNLNSLDELENTTMLFGKNIIAQYI